MLALDVARIEAGLLLIDVDFFSSKKALIDAQRIRRTRWASAGWSASTKRRFIGQRALREEHRRGHARQVVGLEIDWTRGRANLRTARTAADRRRDRLARRGAGL